MRHLRSDYDRIQDPIGKIAEDEPVFLIRGQDPAGGFAVHAYAVSAAAHGAAPEMVAAIKGWSVTMKDYANKMGHGAPDAPAGSIRDPRNWQPSDEGAITASFVIAWADGFGFTSEASLDDARRQIENASEAAGLGAKVVVVASVTGDILQVLTYDDLVRLAG